VKLQLIWRFPWARTAHDVPGAVAGAPRNGKGGIAVANVLDLARQWLAAQGARPQTSQDGVVTGRVPGAESVTYTASAAYARQHAGVLLLTPGSVAREELLAAIVSGGAGLRLRLPAHAGNAGAITRSTITVLEERLGAPWGGDDPDHRGCVDCLEREGRLLIFSNGGGVRSVRLQHLRERITIEAAVSLSVRTHHGLREELARVTVDAATGAVLAPLGAEHLRSTECDVAPEPTEGDLAVARAASAAQVARAARAAGHLARLGSLPDYQRHQAAITETAERHLIEAPDDGRALLGARQSALDRLSATYAVNVSPRVRNWTQITEPVAQMRVDLGAGCAVAVEVDVARQRVEAPGCTSCAQPWRIGARCAEGHVTCLDCQEMCAHCGERRCLKCTAPALTTCATCGAAACAKCVRAAARGQHRSPASSLSTPAATNSEAHDGSPPPSGPYALTGDDLDAMSPATWLALVRWYLEVRDYRIIGESVDDATGTVSFECRSPEAGQEARSVVVTMAQAVPPAGANDLLARRLADERKRRPETGLVFVTRLERRHGYRVTRAHPDVVVADRADILEIAHQQAGAFGHAQQHTERVMDERAAAAVAVRHVLRTALLEAAVSLAGREGAGTAPGAPSTTTIEGVEHDARVLRQLLLACDTLSDDWVELFSATPTRSHTLYITQDAAAIARLSERATHLGTALRRAADSWPGAAARGAPAMVRWRAALGEECALQCRLIASKLGAVEPAAWRDFDAAHPTDAASVIGDAQTAWQRAGLRSKRVRDELESTASPPPQHSASRE
jgi:hypothetical protein